MSPEEAEEEFGFQLIMRVYEFVRTYLLIKNSAYKNSRFKNKTLCIFEKAFDTAWHNNILYKMIKFPLYYVLLNYNFI